MKSFQIRAILGGASPWTHVNPLLFKSSTEAVLFVFFFEPKGKFWRIPLLKPILFHRGKNSLSEVVGCLEIRGTWIRLYIPLPVALHFDAIPFLGSCGVDAVGGSTPGKKQVRNRENLMTYVSLYLKISLKLVRCLVRVCCVSDQLFCTGLTSAIIVGTIHWWSLVHRRSRSRRPRTP